MHPYSRVVAVALMGVGMQSAQGTVEHRTFSTPRYTTNGPMDLTGDGIADLGFFSMGPGPFQVHVHREIAHSVSGGNDLVSPRPAFGATVGVGSAFASEATLGHSEHEHVTGQDGPILWSQWMPGSPTSESPHGYIGLRLFDALNQPHYAWARYQLVSLVDGEPLRDDTYFRVQLHEVAWESTPGAPIQVGAVPSPGVGAALLGGALLASRRRRHV